MLLNDGTRFKPWLKVPHWEFSPRETHSSPGTCLEPQFYEEGFLFGLLPSGLRINISCHIIFGSFAKTVCLFIQSHTICPILKRLIIFIKNMSFLTLQLLYLPWMLSTNIIISYRPHQQVFSILQNSELQRNGHHDRVLFLLHYDE